jgi:hypothetical protein
MGTSCRSVVFVTTTLGLEDSFLGLEKGLVRCDGTDRVAACGGGRGMGRVGSESFLLGACGAVWLVGVGSS